MIIETYHIPDENMEPLNRRLKQVAARAKKLGFPPIEWRELGKEMKAIKGHQTLVHEIEVSGTQPILNDWVLRGKIEQIGDGRTLVKEFGSKDIPAELWSCQPDCDHCKTKRNRNSVYILKHTGSDEFMRVGASCLKDFVNHDNPHLAAGNLEMLLSLKDYLKELDEDAFSPGGKPSAYIKVNHVLVLAAAAIRQDGFISAARGEELLRLSTGQLVAMNLLGQTPRDAVVLFSDIDKEKAERVEQWLLSDAFEGESVDSTYNHNLRSIALLGYVPAKQIPLMASSVMAYDRHLAQQALAANNKLSVHVGVVGEKLADMPVIKKSSRVIPGDQWGDKVLYLFEDLSGNQLKWFSSGKDILIPDGALVHLSGTIKGHTDYKGVQQTELLRVKVNEFELFEHVRNTHGPAYPDNKPAQKLMKRPINPDVMFVGVDVTLLDEAVSYHPSYIEPLLAINANVALQSAEGKTAAHRAVWLGNLESIAILKKLAPLAFDVEDNAGVTADDLMKESQLLVPNEQNNEGGLSM